MKIQIEVFTAACPLCSPVVQLVKETAHDNCEIIIYNLTEKDKRELFTKKINKYGLNKLPSVVVDGKLIDCCQNSEITKEDLMNAGIGKF